MDATIGSRRRGYTASFIHLLPSPPLKARASYFCPVRQRKQNALSSEVRKNKKSPHSGYLFPSVGPTCSDYLVFHRLPSVIFRFLLCASRILFPAHLYLKPLSTKLTAALLLSLSLFSSSSLRVLYTLPTLIPTVDSCWLGYFSWFSRGGVAY